MPLRKAAQFARDLLSMLHAEVFCLKAERVEAGGVRARVPSPVFSQRKEAVPVASATEFVDCP